MPTNTQSDFDESLHQSQNWPGYCQIVKGSDGISLNFSRVPMRTLPPRPRGCTIFPTVEAALAEAIERVASLPSPTGKRSNKTLLPSHITHIHEANHVTI